MKTILKFNLTILSILFAASNLFAQTDSAGNCENEFQYWAKLRQERQRSEFRGDIEAFPKVLKEVAPVYPDSARKYGIEGDLIVWFIVDTTGKPQCARVLEKVGNGMDEAALLAIRDWRFKTLTFPSKKQISPMTMPFKFRLNAKQ